MNNPQILLFVFDLYDEDYRRHYMRLERKNLRDRQNAFQIPEIEFMNTFCLNKQLVHEIIETLQVHVEPSKRNTRIPFHLRVLTALNFFGSGSYQRKTGGHILNCMSQSAVSRSVSEISKLISRFMMPNKIKFPTTNEQKTIIKEGFYRQWEIRGVVGAVDGTHVEIIAPSINDDDHTPHVYINRKGRHSVNVMLICDSNNIIVTVDARYPGSTHDSAIWQMSDINRYLQNCYQNGDKSSHLIGDSGYALEPWLFTPVNNYGENTPEERYNIVHVRARNVIERTNGILKSTFRCLSRHRVLNYNAPNAAHIIFACCVLHNMMREARIYRDEEFLNELENEMNPVHNNDDNEMAHPDNNLILGRQVRGEYIQQNYA